MTGDHTMTNFLKNFWNDEEGATAIEYGLIAGLIAVAIIAAATAVGGNLNNLFCSVVTALSSVPGATAAAATCTNV
jgi:pilus assembly protein Flp/PilA